MRSFTCNIMSKSVAHPTARTAQSKRPAPGTLYTARGARKYLTRAERGRLLPAYGGSLSDCDLLLLTLAWTGARISEVLALTPAAFHVEAGVVAIRTLKRRRPAIREVPIPASLMTALEARFQLSAAQRADDARTHERLWPCCRETAWRRIKAAMTAAGITGRHACPRGLRHGFGVGTLQAGVPLTLVQRLARPCPPHDDGDLCRSQRAGGTGLRRYVSHVECGGAVMSKALECALDAVERMSSTNVACFPDWHQALKVTTQPPINDNDPPPQSEL